MELGERLKRWLGLDWGSRRILAGEPVPVVPAVPEEPADSPDNTAMALLSLPRTDDLRSAALADLDTRDATWWIRFDQALRRPDFATLWVGGPNRLAKALLDGTADALDLVTAGCHGDGRLREAAAIRLAAHPRPAAVAVLALRTCDWAHQVRSAAQSTCLTMLAGVGEDGPLLVTTADLAVALGGRLHGGWLRQYLADLLPELTPEQLAPLLAARADRVRRVAYETAVAHDRLGLDRLLTAAERDRDTLVRRTCAQAVLARSATDLPTLRRLRGSRTALVRAEAVRLLARAGEFDADAALTDPYPLVREVAQAAVRRRGGDPAAHYRRLAVEQPLSLPILAGIGETGSAADADLLSAGLAHPAARGRLTTLRAMRRLGAVPAEPLRALLADPSLAVLRLAARTLAEHPTADPALLRELTRPDQPATSRTIAFRLLSALDLWWALETALSWLDDPDPEIRDLALDAARRWPSGGRLRQPPAPVLARIPAAIDRAEPVLGRPHADMLRFIARVGDHGTR
ncbi:hypothetical protein [Catellatospora tritici]|uniref:hypothetical protein n=1 Tax=Catellatospora tritici TaxID=2851566 RepID=UPI001C2D33E9|nr:hypothetical protein [Catellatospora tritici]MBV1854841.1 hypothetical protein [Catellatospora tritici]